MSSGDRSEGQEQPVNHVTTGEGNGTLLPNPAETVNAQTGEELGSPFCSTELGKPVGFWRSFCLHG